ncbi:tyrosine-type recombinase/integrase [Haloplanus halophilus]|uniref:tyrosine-type recombinase/integrase n=1 Tax=Haloplanus halophilus TaxID=2949993 RepID=UPI00203FDA65|nr:tyrosine-type recombinase/integrase [Haloplanus sp. GDY1]
MADTNDVQEYGRKLQNQLEKLEDADIPDDDRETIRQFVDYLDVRTSNNQGTIVSNLNRLRLAAERGGTPLTEAEESDITALMGTLKREYGLREGTLREYRKALRKFYKWRGEDWGEDIEIGPSPKRSVDPDQLLSDDEIDAILDAAENPRDKAAVALLADTGIRIGALASLRVKDVDLSAQPAELHINEDANVKGASGKTLMTWSRGYVANYLEVHPRRDDPDAALIHKNAGHHTAGEDDGALTYQYLSRRIKEVGERAGIDAGRLNAHNFRKSAITRWIREGQPEQWIKNRAFWVDDSRQFETYSGVTDDNVITDIADHYGIDVGERETARPNLENCPQCGSPLRDTARFCPGCGAPLTQAAGEEKQSVEDATFDSVAAADGQEIDYFAEFRRRFNEDPAFRERVAGDHDESP